MRIVCGPAYSELHWLAHARLRDGGRNTVLDTTFAFDHLLLGITLLMQGRATEALAEMPQESGPGAQALGLAVAYHALHRDLDSDAALSRL